MKLLLNILPKRMISKIMENIANFQFPSWIMEKIILIYSSLLKVNLDEAEHPVSHYKTLNEFFIRRLKKGVRPIDNNPKTIISPVDGTIMDFGLIKEDKMVQVKGIEFSVCDLIKEERYHNAFIDGHYMIIYLSPKDYHRIHSPVDGNLVFCEYNRGHLHPVNSLGLNHIPGLFAINERQTSFIETSYGMVAMVKVAAINVGQIRCTYPVPWTPETLKQRDYWTQDYHSLSLKKGEEMARFELGSTVVLCFPKDTIQFLDNMEKEKPLKLGEAIAEVILD